MQSESIKPNSWEEAIEDQFGYSYEEVASISSYFGVDRQQALGILFISKLSKLQESLGDIAFSLREALKCVR